MTEAFPDFDLYEELQISRRASMDVVKAAYTRLAKKYHPDANPDSEAEMTRLNLAYEVLSDPHQRKAYNRTRRVAKARRRPNNLARRAVPPPAVPPPAAAGYDFSEPPPAPAVAEGPPPARRGVLRCSHCGGLDLKPERRHAPRKTSGPLPGQDPSRLRVCHSCGKTTVLEGQARARGKPLMRRPSMQP